MTLSIKTDQTDKFWKTTPLGKMDAAQWESLCDGCGRCCLQKLENKETGKVYYTWVSCYLLDTNTCRCTFYDMRTTLVPDCLILKQHNIEKLRWLPRTCAYRLVAEGRDLLWWHPLISGSRETVHDAGISVRGKAFSEEFIHPDDVDHYIMDKPF